MLTTFGRPFHRLVIPMCILCVACFGNALAQGDGCLVDLNAVIEDDSTNTYEVEVEGLLINNMVTNDLCGVFLDFEHGYIGDLTIRLVSPGGQSVTLIGPSTDLPVSTTSLSSWQVTFLPNGFTPVPDAGIEPSWNNDQPWEAFENYTGSYHPFSGALEDINAGPANGTWLLVVEDGSPPYSGRINAVRIEFCDNDGLDCEFCNVYPGQFATDTIEFCANEMPSADLFEPQFNSPDQSPESVGNAYEYAISYEGGNFEFGDIDRPNWAPGSYTICGLTFKESERATLESQLAANAPDDLRELFRTGSIASCAALTDNCIEIQVYAEPSATLIDTVICEGEVVQVGETDYGNSGVFDISLLSANGKCDSSVTLILDVRDFRIRLNRPDTITCSNPRVSIDASRSTPGNAGIYSWSTLDGRILADADSSVVLVNTPGTYTVQVADGSGCVGERSIAVVDDQTFPFAEIEPGTIDCATGSHTLDATVFPADAEYQWTGPAGFTSSEANPVVTQDGLYKLTIIDQAGCQVSAVMELEYDTVGIPVEAVFVRKLCGRGQTILRLDRQGPDPSGAGVYSWTGPGGFSLQGRRTAFVAAPGVYTGTYESGNGCRSTTEITVDDDYAIPDLVTFQQDDTLNCGAELLLTASSTSPGVDYSWSGPGVDVAGQDELIVRSAGSYTVTAEAPNGCTATETFDVFDGNDLLDIEIFSDTLDCVTDTAQIGVFVADPAAQFAWSGPGVLDPNLPFTRAIEPGTYVVEITTGGCEQSTAIEVPRDDIPVRLALVRDTVTCDRQLVPFTFRPRDEPPVRYEWILGNSPPTTDSIVMVDGRTRIELRAWGENGCRRRFVLRAPVDTLPPDFFLPNVTFGCVDSAQIFAVLLETTRQVRWEGSFGFSSDRPDPFISRPGRYTVEVTGLNGCVDKKEIDVLADIEEPDTRVLHNLWSCIDSSATIEMGSADTTLRYSWFYQGDLVGDSSVLITADTGEFKVVARALNSCETITDVYVDYETMPDVEVPVSNLNCRDRQVILEAFSDSAGLTYEWTAASGELLGSDSSIVIAQAEDMELTATWINGCTSSTVISVIEDTLRPVAVATSFGSIQCDKRNVVLDGTASLGDSLIYSWTTRNGNITGPDSLVTTVADPGTYILRVENQGNYCFDEDSLLIEELDNPLTRIWLSVIGECEDASNGQIGVDSVSGAMTELLYTLSDVGSSDVPTFSGLEGGIYVLTVRDTFGCTLDTVVNLNQTASEASINLGADVEVLLGNSTQLRATLDIDSSEVGRVYWDIAADCDTCLTIEVTPLETTDYTVFLEDIYGCTARDVIRVIVDQRASVYVPNIFSPNGDGANDILQIAAHPGVERINSFEIYDRWGNLVYGAEDFDPRSGAFGWDGNFSGSAAQPGVYTYIYRLRTLNDLEEVHTGSITLVR